jgi:dTDP-4-dehydrorhamnose 3,5-epimerase-like enzyme
LAIASYPFHDTRGFAVRRRLLPGCLCEIFMEIIQIKEIEFNQDDRGWSIKPIADEEIRTSKISDVHMVSMRPGAIRGNHYHVYKTEHMLVIGGTCRFVSMDNNTKKREEKIIEQNKKILLVIPPNVTHAIENVSNEISYLLCYSKVKEDLDTNDVVKNIII